MTDKELETAVLVFAHYLGIDIEKERDLIDIAQEALEDLPDGWQLGIGEDDSAGIPYFYNDDTGESSWHHPEEKKYMKIIKQEKQRLAEKQQNSRQNKTETNKNTAEVNKSGAKPTAGKSDQKTSSPRPQQQSQQQQSKRYGNSNSTNKQDSRKDDSSSDGDHDDDDVVEILDVEDFDEPEPTIRQVKKSSTSTKPATTTVISSTSAKPQQRAESTVTSAFSLNPSDFFDEPSPTTDPQPPQSPESNWNRIKDQRGRGIQEKDKDPDPASYTQQTKSVKQESQASEYLTSRSQNDEHLDDSASYRHRSKMDSPRIADSMRDQRRYDDRDRDRDERKASEDSRRGGKKDYDRDLVVESTSAGTRAQKVVIDDRRGGSSNSRSTSAQRTRREEEERSSSRGRQTVTTSNEREKSPAKSNNKTSTTTGSKALVQEDSQISNSKYITMIQKLEEQLLDSQSECTQLQQLIRDNRQRHEDEVEALKKYTRRIEDRAAEERDEKKALQDKLLRLESDKDHQIHEAEDQNAERIREITKKIRQEVENEWKERLRVNERRFQDDIDDLNSQIAISKKRCDEALKEVEVQKKRIVSSREDGRLEILAELEETKQQLSASEQQGRVLGTEIKKLREDQITLSSRLTNAMQQMQVANAEADTARLSNTSALNDYQAANAALIAATQRIAAMDVDNANLRAEVMALKRENEEIHSSYRKLQQSTSITGDRLGLAENEAKRVKQQAVHEVNRLSSRVIELEAIVQQQLQQIDKASTLESENIRNVQRQLTKAEYTNTMLTERLQDMEQHRYRENTKISNLEKELQTKDEQIFKRDRQAREFELQIQQLKDKYEYSRKQYEDQLNEQAMKLRAIMEENEALESKHQSTVSSLQEEVSARLPSLVSASIQQVELKYSQKLAMEINECRNQSELSAEQRWRNKLHEIQSAASEKESKIQRALLDQRMENDELREMIKSLKRRMHELEYEHSHQQHLHQQSAASASNAGRENSHHTKEQDTSHHEEKSNSSINMRTSMSGLLNQSVDIDPRIIAASAEEATSFLIQSQLESMRKQLGRYLDSNPPTSISNISTTRYAPARATVSFADDVTHLKSSQSLFSSPQQWKGQLNVSSSYELPASLMKSHIPSSATKDKEYLDDDEEASFEAIEDGGYHQGYWRAKYSSTK
jgi:hypothetical protein